MIPARSGAHQHLCNARKSARWMDTTILNDGQVAVIPALAENDERRWLDV
jgi:hypothetical protein